MRDLTLTTNLEGILLDHSSDSKIENVTVLNCESGLALKSSSNITVTNNNASNNSCGICLGGSSSKNTVGNNNCLYNSRGIELSASSCNLLTNNICNSNNDGIALFSSSNNKIYLNNFINNTDNFYPSTSSNIWNSTLKISYTYKGNTYTNYMGNYWSDYSGNDTNDDGIGDIPYDIDSDQDNCPLIQSWENYIVPAPSFFDTGAGTYSSIMGTHKGEIRPLHNISVSKLYTCPCAGTGGSIRGQDLQRGTTRLYLL